MGWMAGSCGSLCKGGPCSWKWEVGAPSWLELVAWLHSDICQNCFVKRSLVGPQVRLCCQFSLSRKGRIFLWCLLICQKNHSPEFTLVPDSAAVTTEGREGVRGAVMFTWSAERNLILGTKNFLQYQGPASSYRPLAPPKHILWTKLYG